MKKINFFTTIKGKFLIYNTILFSLIVLLILGFYFIIRDNLITDSKNNIRINTNRIALNIENSNQKTSTISKVMATAQETGLFGKRIESVEFAKKILKQNPQLTGAYFAYEPNADFNDKNSLQYLENVNRSIDSSGRFLPYWYRVGTDLDLIPLMDMDISLYYQGTKEKFYSKEKEKSNLTEPYFYNGKMIIEYTTPIVINNEFVGIAGVDKSLVEIGRFLDKFKLYKNSNYVLISNKGRVIVSSMNLATKDKFEEELEKKVLAEKEVDTSQLDKKMLTFNIDNTSYSEVLNTFYNMREREKLLESNDYYFFATKIKTGNWTLLTRVSKTEVTAPIDSVLLKFLMIIVAFFIVIGFILILLSRKINDLITNVVNTSLNIANGHYEIKLPDFSIHEFKILKETMIKTVTELKRFKDDLELLVKERTKELSLSKEQLEDSNNELEITIENLKKTQKQLVESEKMASLGNLVAGVAHEINTPVGIGLTGSTHLSEITSKIKKSYEKNSMTQREFENYLKTSEELSTLVTSNLNRAASLVKSFKQVAVDQTSEKKRTFNLKDYINEVLSSINSVIRKTKLDIKIVCEDNILIESYPGAISQVLTNLIMNSIIHGYKENEKGTIVIEIIQRDSLLKIIYTDDGKGISKENISRVFEPFFTTNRESGGSGLGLNIIYNIVTTKLNGKIQCIDNGNKGARFEISLSIK